IALAYVWNDAQTEARLTLIGATVPTSFTDADGSHVDLDWAVPNRNQCTGCHAREGGNAVLPLGPTARNLNRDYSYSGYFGHTGSGMPIIGLTDNQLNYWSNRGLLAGAPDDVRSSAPHLPNAYDASSGAVEARARAYLDVNCAHCHNPNGPAHTSGLD